MITTHPIPTTTLIKGKKETQTQGCKHCGKTYSRKTALEKHSLLCAILKNNKTNNKSQNDDEPLPTQRQMFKTIQELVLRCEQLTEKVETLEKHMIKTKKKLNVVEWCNGHYTNNPPLTEFLKQIVIPDKTIDCLFDECIYTVLQNWLSKVLQDKTKSPFLSFSNQHHELYVCIQPTNELTIQPTTWQKMEKAHLIHCMNFIQKKMLFMLHKWKKDTTSQAHDEDKIAILYSKAMNKLLISYQDAHVLSRVKNILYDIVKIDVKQIVEYELDVA